jgi:thiamine-phosphate pyrophosphorylase
MINFHLYLITDRARTRGRPLEKVVEEALKGGVSAVQVREKDMSSRQLYDLVLRIRELTLAYKAKLIINDRLDIALSTGADGIHLGNQSLEPHIVRPLAPENFIIGVSTHSLDQVQQAEDEGADFITFGPVYETPSKRKYGHPVGVSALKEVCRRVNLPVFALGGINNKEKIKEIKQAGSFGIALISALISAHDVRAQASDFIKELENYNDTH